MRLFLLATWNRSHRDICDCLIVQLRQRTFTLILCMRLSVQPISLKGLIKGFVSASFVVPAATR